MKFEIVVFPFPDYHVSRQDCSKTQLGDATSAKINISPVNLQDNRTVHDSLCARSLILQVQDTRIAFISLDLGGYINPVLLEKLKKDYKLDELYFCPSHTHSGATDRNTIDAKLTSIIKEASNNMFEAKISAGNHRLEDGTIFWKPDWMK